METMSLPEKYSNDEMERILQRALSRRSESENVSRGQLIEVGKELGLSEQELLKAIDDELRYGAFDEAKEEVIEKRRREWRNHFLWYLGVNALTVSLNLAADDRLTWAFGTLFGWGIGMAMHTIGTFFPKEKELNKAAKKLLRKKRDKYNELGE